MQKPPSLRNNNGTLQVRVRIDGRDAFINRLGRWDDPVAVAKAQAISAQIWSDYQQGSFDRSLMAYQPLINGKEVGLLEALRVRAESKRQAAAIHAYRVLQRYGQPIRNRREAEVFLRWLREERGLSDCTIAGLMTHYRQCSGGNRQLFTCRLKWQRRSVQSDVLSVDEIQAVLADLKGNEPWYYPLFLLWLSTGMRNAEIRGLTWDCIRWEESEVLVCKSLRRDGYSSGKVEWAPTKTGKERVVPLTPLVLETLKKHQQAMEQLGIYDAYGLVFVTPTSHSNIYDHLVGRVWHRSLLHKRSYPCIRACLQTPCCWSLPGRRCLLLQALPSFSKSLGMAPLSSLLGDRKRPRMLWRTRSRPADTRASFWRR